MGSDSLAVENPERRRVAESEERTWLTRHLQGDENACPALLEAYRRPVYGYLVRNGVAAADRDDVFQSIFLKVHAGAKAYDPARPLAPWLFTIVANTVRNTRRGGIALVAVTSNDEASDLPDPNPGPEHIAEARETVAWLERALAALPPDQREVLLLVTVVGMLQEEAARSLDLPLNTVKTRLRRARLTLAAGLAERDEPAESTGDSHDQL
jgi:RNA polymerase sigma-70 factor (ECF subfamily)